MITTVVYNVFFLVGADRLAATGEGHVLLCGCTRVLRPGHQHLERRRRAAGAITAVGVVQRQTDGRKLAGTNLLVRH
jgi:hypothetical protein